MDEFDDNPPDMFTDDHTKSTLPPLPDNLSNDDVFVYALRDLSTSE